MVPIWIVILVLAIIVGIIAATLRYKGEVYKLDYKGAIAFMADPKFYQDKTRLWALAWILAIVAAIAARLW